MGRCSPWGQGLAALGLVAMLLQGCNAGDDGPGGAGGDASAGANASDGAPLGHEAGADHVDSLSADLADGLIADGAVHDGRAVALDSGQPGHDAPEDAASPVVDLDAGDGPSGSAADGPFDVALAQDAPGDLAAGAPTEAGTVDSGAGGPGLVCGTSCPPGQRLCGLVCRRNDETRFGCGARDCQPCALWNAEARCGSAGCEVARCLPGWGKCDDRAGCVTWLIDRAHCGACDVKCRDDQVCSSTGCVDKCPAGQIDCGGHCEDLKTSPVACGKCYGGGCALAGGHITSCLEGGKVCSQAACIPPLVFCGGDCVDPSVDVRHCGGCSACPSATGGEAYCDEGKCALKCASGYTPCSDSACQDLERDPDNCGACGHPCGTGACVAGKCVAPDFAIAHGLVMPTDIALDDDYVYWLDPGVAAISRVRKAGGDVQPVVSGEPGALLRMAVDETYVYWTTPADIRRAVKSGGKPEIVVKAEAVVPGDKIFGILVDAQHIYWSQSGPGGDYTYGGPTRVFRTPRANPGSAERMMVDPLYPFYGDAGDMAGDDEAVYVVSKLNDPSYRLTRIEKKSMTASMLGQFGYPAYSSFVSPLALDCDRVILTSFSTLGWASAFFVDKHTGGTVAGSLDTFGIPMGVATDGVGTYVAAGPGLLRAARGTSQSVVLFTGPSGRLVLDASSVYWLGGGAVYARPK